MGDPIDRLTIKGFKSIQKIEDFRFGPLNVLIGANGAGKSNLISFFRLLRAMADESLEGFVNDQGGSAGLFFMGPKRTKTISARLEFGMNRYEVWLRPATGGPKLIVDKELIQYTGSKYSQYICQGKLESGLKAHKDDKSSFYPNARGVGYYVYQSVSNWTVYHFHDTSGSASVRHEGTIRDYEELHHDAANLAAFLLKLRESDHAAYEVIRDTVRLVAPFFDDFLLRPKKAGSDEVVLLEWQQKGSTYPFHPSQLSDGTLRFVCLATALLQPKPPATMIFDEPELGMHPYATTVLAGLLKQAAGAKQVIVSTQSAHLLDHFQPEDVIVVDRSDGASVFRRLESGDLSEWLKGYSLGELWQKNVFEGGPTHE